MTEEMLEAFVEDFQLGNWEEEEFSKFYFLSPKEKLEVIIEYARNVPGFDGFMIDELSALKSEIK